MSVRFKLGLKIIAIEKMVLKLKRLMDGYSSWKSIGKKQKSKLGYKKKTRERAKELFCCFSHGFDIF